MCLVLSPLVVELADDDSPRGRLSLSVFLPIYKELSSDIEGIHGQIPISNVEDSCIIYTFGIAYYTRCYLCRMNTTDPLPTV